MSFVKHVSPLMERTKELDKDLISDYDTLIYTEKDPTSLSIKSLESYNIFLSEEDIVDILYYSKMYRALDKFNITDSKKYDIAKQNFDKAIKIIDIYSDLSSVIDSFPRYKATHIRIKIIQIFQNQKHEHNSIEDVQQMGEEVAKVLTNHTTNINYNKDTFSKRDRENRNIDAIMYESSLE